MITLCNLFVNGGSLKQRVVGRVFTEDVKQGGENTFFSQIAVPDQPVRQSVINFAGRDPFSIVEQYY
ncbi:MAG: disulfide bond chaperone, partial [Verrucomicrobiota bacterium]